MVLSLINIPSTTAFNAILSLSSVSLTVSYLIPIILLVMKRISHQDVPWGPFRLGRFGLFVNIFAILYGIFICVFLIFPPFQPVTATNMNYASPVFGLILVFQLGLVVCLWERDFQRPDQRGGGRGVWLREHTGPR